MGEKNQELEEQKKEKKSRAGLFAAMILLLLLLLLAIWFFFFRGKTKNEKVGNDGDGGFWSEVAESRVGLDGEITKDAGKSDPGKTDPGKTDPGKTDPGKTDPGKTDPGKTDPGETDPGKTDPGKDDASEEKHVHNWVDITETIHHDAVYEDRWIVDEGEWDETVIDQKAKKVTHEYGCKCGAHFKTSDELRDHLYNYGSNEHGQESWVENIPEKSHVVHHDATGHYESYLEQEAWDETIVTGQKCSICGAVK